MFDLDDMLQSFAVALAIVLVIVGTVVSVFYASDYGRVWATLAVLPWVYISFRLFRFFRMWALRDDIHRKDFFLRHMPPHDPDRPEFVERRNEAERELQDFNKDK